MKNKLILTDCDGVLLDWEWAFTIWMQERGYVQRHNAKNYYQINEQFDDLTGSEAKKFTKLFNESAAIGFLPPLRDSVYYVKRLHEEYGYEFHCITSLSTDRNAQRLREMNLQKVFGKNIFTKVICLDTGSDKDAALEPYKDSGLYWIEDKYANFKTGLNIGLKSILVEHGHNMNDDITGGFKAKNWREIYEIITGEVNVVSRMNG
jgi:FMN phosphatase YigB (HAD superfamily)